MSFETDSKARIGAAELNCPRRAASSAERWADG
jgi:hypothetical protein